MHTSHVSAEHVGIVHMRVEHVGAVHVGVVHVGVVHVGDVYVVDRHVALWQVVDVYYQCATMYTSIGEFFRMNKTYFNQFFT